MTNLLAAEGGYQSFKLHGGDWFWLIFSALTAVLAIGVGVGLMKNVLAADEGTPKMRDIAKAIEEGALAYLRRQFRTIVIILVPLVVLVFLTATKIARPDGSIALGFVPSGIFRTLAFLLGCCMSGLTGFIGMSLAVKGNVRTAAAARGGSLPAALKVAFRTGGVTGMFTVGLGLIGATTIIMIFQNTSSVILIGFGFGGSLLALFLRVGGGIFTKAADVGADLVGKVEAGIPEDDPRNAATIADNVGDNVGDCAGMAADLFESYEVTLVASIILGVAAFKSIGANPALGLIFPVIARALGVLCSIVGVFVVKASPKDRTAMAPINRGFFAAGVLTVITTFIVAMTYIGNKHHGEGWKVFGAVTAGLVLAQALSRLTEYFTSTETRPVKEIAEAARTGPATVVLSGISSGLESSVYAILLIALTIGVAIWISGGNIEFAFYLVALVGMGMLATTGVVVSEDTFGPVSDNAAGIAEMSGEFGGEPERIMVSLDAVGNTTKAVTKGFAIGSAVIAAVALFSSFVETIGDQVPSLRSLGLSGSKLFSAVAINVADPKTFIGLMVGGSIAFMFSALAIRAVGRTAGTVVQEVRRQFREHPGIMNYTEKPEYGRVIDICTTSALRELATPALLAVLAPVVIGFGLGYLALGAFLAAVIVVGQLMANFLSNAGGAWDNAKKYIEDGHEGGKGSDAHKAAVIGDTVGDPFKDTAGPALNPLIKVMNLVSLLILPAIITLDKGQMRTKTSTASYVVAILGLIVLIGAVAYSKRKTTAMDEGVPGATPPGAPTALVGAPTEPGMAAAGNGSGRDPVAAPWQAAAPTTPGAAPGTWAPGPDPNAPGAPTWAGPAGPTGAAPAWGAPGGPGGPGGPAAPAAAGPGWGPPGGPAAPAPGWGPPGAPSGPAAPAPGWGPPGAAGGPAAPAPSWGPLGGPAAPAPSWGAPGAPGGPVAPGGPAAAAPGWGAPAAPAPGWDAPAAPAPGWGAPGGPGGPVGPVGPPAGAPGPVPGQAPGAWPPVGAPAPAPEATGAWGAPAAPALPAQAAPGTPAPAAPGGPVLPGDELGETPTTVLGAGAGLHTPPGPAAPAAPAAPTGGPSEGEIPTAAAPPARGNKPGFLAPVDHGTLDSSEPFRWTAVPGATEYCVTVGTVRGGADLLNTGSLPPTTNSYAATNLPVGQSLWARVYASVGGRWSHSEIGFSVASSQSEFTWPMEGQTGVRSDRPFTWTRAPWAVNHWLTVGSSEGGSDLLNTGPLPASQTSYANLPAWPPGVVLHARLLTNDGQEWTYVDVTFTAAS